jgi:hypothetical protein
MKNKKKTATPKRDRRDFSLCGLNYNFTVEPCKWPVLEIHATALWYGDTYKVPNTDLLTAGIIKTIERAFGARSAK